jgi:hypothetical protein
VKFRRKRYVDKIDEMIANSSFGTPGARELIARTPRKVADDIVRRVNEITDRKTMGIHENATALKAAADCNELRAALEQLVNLGYGKTDDAARLLGEGHLGTTAITGQVARIAELGEQMTEAIGLLEFTMNNVADQIMAAGGS